MKFSFTNRENKMLTEKVKEPLVLLLSRKNKMMKSKLTLIIKAPQHFTAEGTESET
jgi:hypothetical protein